MAEVPSRRLRSCNRNQLQKDRTNLVFTDRSFTCRWPGSQQTGPVHTTRRSDARAARRRPWLCCGTHDACPVLYIFFRFRQCKNY